MRVRTFTAPSLAQAMAQVRSELGDDAVIISTRTGAYGRGAQVEAAVEPPDADEAVFDRWEEDRSQPAPADDHLRRALAYHGVPQPLAIRLLQAAAAPADDPDAHPSPGANASSREREAPALASALGAFLAFQPLGDARSWRPLMLVGPPGAGKTLSAAKLMVAAHRSGRNVLAATCDTRRAGGFEQLQAFTRILGVALAAADQPTALAAVVAPADRGAAAAAVIDTAGTNPFDAREMRALGRLIEAADAEPLLVMAAGLDPREAGDVATAFARLGCRRMLATRLDVTRRLGALVAAAETGRLALAGVGISPDAADPPAPIAPLSLSRLLLSTTPDHVPAHLAREDYR
jgi:flagellar biosynthesis protein FlhF